MILIWGYHLLLLTLLKTLKNTSMETSYFTKMFYQKKDESRIQRMQQKTRKETKRWRRRLKVTGMKMLRHFDLFQSSSTTFRVKYFCKKSYSHLRVTYFYILK